MAYLLVLVSALLSVGAHASYFPTINGSTVAVTNVAGSTITAVLTNSNIGLSAGGNNVGTVNGSTVAITNVSGSTITAVLTNSSVGLNTGGNNVGTVSGSTVTVTTPQGQGLMVGGVVSNNPLNLAVGTSNYLRLDSDGDVLVSLEDPLPVGGNQIGAVLVATQTVLSSTSGVMGSVSLGNSSGKSIVSVSSTVATAAVGTVVLSSYTVTAGKTFYLQHLVVRGFLTTPAVSNTNFGNIVVTQQGVTFSSSAFNDTNSSSFHDIEQYDFSEPVPIPSQKTIFATVNSISASAVTWMSTFIGYEK